MKQQTLAMAADQNAQYEQYRRPTKRHVFLATMEEIVPWAELWTVIEPHYPMQGNGPPPGGPGADAAHVLRAAVVQPGRRRLRGRIARQHGAASIRRHRPGPRTRSRCDDAAEVSKFRRLLETHKVGEALFAKVGEVLQARGATRRCTRRARASSTTKGCRAGQWPVVRPETGVGVTQSAKFACRCGQMNLDLGIAHSIATGCRTSRP
jgi:hypothetical protein